MRSLQGFKMVPGTSRTEEKPKRLKSSVLLGRTDLEEKNISIIL